LKQTLKSVNETWSVGRRTLLETIVGGSLAAQPGIIRSETSNPIVTPKDCVEVIQPIPSVPASSSSTATLHPILGEMLYDLKYKKIYLASIKSLVNATVWEKQRTLRHARAELIANTKIDNRSLASLPGTITCYRHLSTGSIGIFDGQHRVAALFLLAQKGLWSETDRNILVEVFDVEDEVSEVMRLFKEINSAEPVNMMDMLDDEEDDEDEAATAVAATVLEGGVMDRGTPAVDIKGTRAAKPLTNKQVKHIINDACARLHEQFGDVMFKPSKLCHAPHVNIDRLREDLFESEVCHDPALCIRTAKQLIAHIHAINDQLGERTDEQWLGRTGVATAAGRKKCNALAKARQHGLFIGMDKMWLLQR